MRPMNYEADKDFLENDRTFRLILRDCQAGVAVIDQMNLYLKKLFDGKHLSALYKFSFNGEDWDIKS